MTQTIDSPFITLLEQKNENVHFYRIDADLSDNFVDESLSEETAKDYTDKLTELFKKALDVENITIKVEALKNKDLSSMLTLSEESRRMQEMMNTPTICCQLYDLAVLANRPLSADAMTKFVARSNEILSILAK